MGKMEEIAIKRTVYSWHAPYKVTLGEAYARFLEGMKQKKILGNICPVCNGLYVPPRPFCDKCLEQPTEWIETDGMATLVTFSVALIQLPGLPEVYPITGMIKVGNSVTNFLHFVAGIDYDDRAELVDKVKIGMKLRPVWKEQRTGDILDLDYFEPVS
jgi:uncharacterized OB-fold protein